jgi:hypothetical protein
MPQRDRHCISLITASQVVLGNPETMPITFTNVAPRKISGVSSATRKLARNGFWEI